jgi:hypothetical protein
MGRSGGLESGCGAAEAPITQTHSLGPTASPPWLPHPAPPCPTSPPAPQVLYTALCSIVLSSFGEGARARRGHWRAACAAAPPGRAHPPPPPDPKASSAPDTRAHPSHLLLPTTTTHTRPHHERPGACHLPLPGQPPRGVPPHLLPLGSGQLWCARAPWLLSTASACPCAPRMSRAMQASGCLALPDPLKPPPPPPPPPRQPVHLLHHQVLRRPHLCHHHDDPPVPVHPDFVGPLPQPPNARPVVRGCFEELWARGGGGGAQGAGGRGRRAAARGRPPRARQRTSAAGPLAAAGHPPIHNPPPHHPTHPGWARSSW